MIKDLLAACGSLVFPPHCLLCFKPLGVGKCNGLCNGCENALQWNEPPFCLKCSRHLKGRFSLCINCRQRRIHYDFAYAALQFNGPLQQLLHRYKYQHTTALRLLFADYMVGFVRRHQLDVDRFDLIAPVPLHASQQRWRGYNQSLLLAREISRAFSIPCHANLLQKNRPTRSQSELKRKERWTNLVGAFTINRSVGLKDRQVLLVDDLLTTGATASAAAQALKEAGCATVGVLTLAAVI
jgi:ComF family protein